MTQNTGNIMCTTQKNNILTRERRIKENWMWKTVKAKIKSTSFKNRFLEAKDLLSKTFLKRTHTH